MSSDRAPTPPFSRLHPRGLLGVLALATVAVALAAAGAAARRPARPRYLNPTEWSVLRNINWERAHFGLRALRPDVGLTRAADAHTREMASRLYYAHNSLSGRPWYARVRHYVRAKTVAETLGYISGRRSRRSEPKTIVRAWMASPEHRAILLSRSVRRIGIARQSKRSPGRPAFYTADFASLH